MSASHISTSDDSYSCADVSDSAASSSQLGRVEGLAAKLGHGIADVRARAASSLLFKLESGVLPPADLARSPETLRSVAAHLNAALCGVLASDDGKAASSSSNSVSHDEVRSLLRLSVHLASAARLTLDGAVVATGGRVGGVPEALTGVLDSLYAMSARPALEATLAPAIAEAITAVCSACSPAPEGGTAHRSSSSLMGSSSALKSSSFNSIMDELTPSMGKSQTSVRPSRGLAPTAHGASYQADVPAASSRRGQQRSQGPGSVIYTPLCAQGWRFPTFQLTEYDEKVLFDIEVRLKMSQEGTYRRLFDALEDFPAQAFLSRPGLLAALLDEVGTPAILAAAPVAANGRLRFEDGAGAMHLLGIESRGYMTPLAAMDWFGQLLSKLKEEVSTQFDGGLAAGAVTQSSPSSEHATVVSMMTEQMHAYRYPQRTPSDPSSSAASAFGTVGASLPVSVSGIAFAVSAAAMSVLRTRDVPTSNGALNLLKVSLPLSIDGMSVIQGSDAAVSQLHSILVESNTARVQHLLASAEQLLDFSFRGVADPERVGAPCRTLLSLRSLVESASPSASVTREMEDRCCEVNTFRCVLSVLLLLPAKFCVAGCESDDSSAPKFVINEGLMNFILMGAASGCGNLFEELHGRADFLRTLLSKTNSWKADFFFELEKAVDAFSHLLNPSPRGIAADVDSIECTVAFLESIEKRRETLSADSSGAAVLNAIDKLREGFEDGLVSTFIDCCRDLDGDNDDQELFQSLCDRCLVVLTKLVTISAEACNRICDALFIQISALSDAVEAGTSSAEYLSSTVHHLTKNGDEAFVYVLIAYGFLDRSDTGEPCKLLLTKLLQYMCIGPPSIVTGVCFHRCLYPLQLLLWHYRSETVPRGADDFVSGLSEFCEKLLQSCALVLFSAKSEIDEEEDPSMSLTAEDTSLVQLDYEKAIIMGMFHSAAEVRREACMRAAHYYKLSLARRAAAFARSDDPYSLFDCDSFMNLIAVQKARNNAILNGSREKSFMSFGDVGNLSRIAFRPRPDAESPSKMKFVMDDDVRIRITAIDQLAQALLSDDSLADTVNAEDAAGAQPNNGAIGWASATAQSCVYFIDQLIAFLHGTPSFFSSEKSIDEDQCVRLISGSAHLLYVLIAKVKSVRDKLTFKSLSDIAASDVGNAICAHTVLKIALAGASTTLGIPSSLSKDTSVSREAERLRFHSLALLCVWSLDSGCESRTGAVAPKAWTLRHLRTIEAAKAEQIHDCTLPATVLQIPSDRAGSAPEDADSSSTTRFAALPVMLNRTQFTPEACRKEGVLLGAFVNNCIARAGNHVALNRAINVSLSLTGVGASMLSRCPIEDRTSASLTEEDLFSIRSPLRTVDFDSGGVVSALKTSLQVAPSTVEDAVSFHQIAILLRRLVSARAGEVEEEYISNYYNCLVEFLFGPAHIDLLESVVFHSSDERFSYFASAAVCDSLALMGDLICKFQPQAKRSGFRRQIDLIADMLEGSALPVLLTRIAASESLPVRLTARAWKSLRTLFENFAAAVTPSLRYDVASCIYEEDPNMTADSLAGGTMSRIMSYFPVRNAMAPFHESLRVNSLYQNNPSYSALGDIIATARMLRAPDSMMGTSSAIGSLKLLRLLIGASKSAAEDRTTPLDLRSSVFSWASMSWLLRYLHDRRGIVRVIAVDTIGKVIDISSIAKQMISGSESSSNELLPSPISNLKHILLDDSEAPLVRFSCLKIIVNVFLAFCASHIVTGHTPVVPNDLVEGKSSFAVVYRSLLSAIVQTVHSFVDRAGSSCDKYICSSANRQVLAAFESILNENEYFKYTTSPVSSSAAISLTTIQEHIVQHCRPFKLFSKIVNVIDPPGKDAHRSSAVNRALSSMCGAPGNTESDRGSNSTLWISQPNLMDSTISEWFATQRTHAAIASVKAMVVCQRLSEIGSTAGVFSECVRNTNLVKNVISCLISSVRDGGRLRSTSSFVCSNLLGAMLLDENVHNQEVRGKYFGISDLLKDNTAVQLSIVRSIVGCIQHTGKGLSVVEPDSSEAANALVHINAFVRVLSLIIDSAVWRRNLGLGVPFFCPEDALPEWSSAPLLLDTLSAAYEAVSACHAKRSQPKDAFSISENRILFCLGALFRHSSAVRQLQTRRTLDAGDSLVTGVIDKLSSLLEGMETSAPVLSMKDPSVSKSLKLLKSKFSSPMKKASLDSASPSKMSPDSVAKLPSPTHANRINPIGGAPAKTWREKTRSFNVSSSKVIAEPRARPNSSIRSTTQESGSKWYLAPIDRSSLWSCLLLLQGILLDSSAMQFYCRQHGLGDFLERCTNAMSTWASVGSVDRGYVEDVFYRNTTHWCPSHGQIATAALSCMSSLLYREQMEEDEDVPSRDSTVSSLLTNALKAPNSAIAAAGRCRASQWLSMSLVSSILRPVAWEESDLVAPKRPELLGTISSTRRKLFMRSLYAAVQSYLESLLHSSHAGNASVKTADSTDMFSGLNAHATLSEPVVLAQTLDILSSLASVTFPKAPTSEDSTLGSGPSQSLPWPDLVAWLRDVQGARGSALSVSLSRLIGRIDAAPGAATKKLSPLSSSDAALDTLIGYLLDEDDGSIVDAWTTNGSDRNSARDLAVAAAAVGLWSIAHRSEQAKAVLRQRRPELLAALQGFDERRPSVAAALRGASASSVEGNTALQAVTAVKRILVQS